MESSPVGWLLLVLPLACAPAAPLPATPPPVAPPPAPTEVVLASPVSPDISWVAARDEDGTLDVLAGPWRATIEGEAVKVAEDAPWSPIRRATRVAGGWLFLGRDGLLTRSDTFAGPLRRAGEIPAGLASVAASQGRLAVIDDRDRLWTSDGGAPALAALPGDALAAAFADARHGAVVLDGGALLRTTDGGSRWERVALRGDAAIDVWIQGGRLVVGLGAGPRALGEDGTLGPAPDAAAPPPGLDAAGRRSLAGALARRLGLGAADVVLPGGRGFRLDYEHSMATMLGSPDAELVTTGPAGETRRRLPEVAPDTLFALHPWGPALAALGSAAVGGPIANTVRVFRSDDGGPFERLLTGPVLRTGFVFSDDGQHVAWPGACEKPRFDTRFSFTIGAASAVCVVNGTHDPGRTVTPEGGAAKLLSMHGDTLLFATPEGHLGALHGDTGDRVALPAATTPERGRQVKDARYGADDTLVVVYQRGEEYEAEVGLRSLGGRPRPLALPAGARAVAFADQTRGVAAGASAAALWRTLDGGATWSPVPVPIDGSPGSVSLEGTARCDASGCALGEALHLRGWGPWAEPARKLLAAQAAPGAPPPAPARFAPPQTHATCVSSGPEVKDAGPEPPREHAVELAAAGAVARLFEEIDPQSHETLRASWKGKDARGPFQATAPASALPAGDGAAVGMILRAATRKGLLFERCPEDYLTRGCALLWAQPRGGLRALPYRSGASEFHQPPTTVMGALPLADGGVLLGLYGREVEPDSGLSKGPTVDRLLRVGPDGSVVAERVFVWRTETIADMEAGRPSFFTLWTRLRALAVHRGTPGLAVADRRDPTRLRFYPLGRDMAAEPEDLPALRTGPLSPCAAAADPEAASLVAPSLETWGLWIDPGDHTSRGVTRAMVEVGSGGTCLRAAESWALWSSLPQPRWSGNGMEIHAAENGAALVGTTGGWATRSPVRCTVK